MRFFLDRLRLSVTDMEDIKDLRGTELRQSVEEVARLSRERAAELAKKADRAELKP